VSGKESAPAAGEVNWEAYSHEELHQMLWQDADVADVSMVATEWTQHRAALDTHAEVLREQRVALLDSWQGTAAEEAANRLDVLAARVEKISELAHAGQQAAQDAADALAMARAMMPPPPGNPAAPFAGVPASWAPAAFDMADFPAAPAPSAPFVFPATPVPAAPSFSAQSFAMPNYAEMFAPAAATSTPGMNTAFGAVGSAGFSFYVGAASMDQQKAEAVRAMQTYESSLTGSSRLIDQARGAIPPAATTTRAGRTTAGPGNGPGNGGVPWGRLVGAGPIGASGGGMGSVIGGPGAPGAGSGVPLGSGQRVGALPGVAGGPGVSAGQLAAESAAARAAGHGGMVPPVGGQRGGAEDERHENQMPTISHGLFTVEMLASPAVIGETMGEQP
jgi:hypothetical protein